MSEHLDLTGAERINVACPASEVPRFVAAMYENGYVMGQATLGGFFGDPGRVRESCEIDGATQVELVFVRDRGLKS